MALNARPAWPTLLDPSFRTIATEEEKKFPSVISQVFNMQKSDKAFEKDTSVSGLGTLTPVAEGDNITYQKPVPGYPVTYTPAKFASGEMITYEMYTDDLTNVMKRSPARLGRAKAEHREQYAADVFNYAFTYGTGGKVSFYGGDGKALCATDHPLKDANGTTQGNSSTADLDEDSLEAGMLAMRATLDNKGIKTPYRADTLLIPPALEKEARILLESQLRTGTGNNDINPYKGRLNIVVWDYLTSDTAWFLLDSRQHSVNFIDRDDRGIEGPEYEFDNKTAKWSVMVRYAAGFSDWRGVYGSTGTN